VGDQRAARRTPAAAALAIAAAIGGCTGQLAGDTPAPAAKNPPTIPTTGNALIVPVVPGALGEVRFQYTVSGNGIEPINGSIDASPTNAARVIVTDLAPASGYLVLMREPSGCNGAASFTIEAAKTAAVTVQIICPGPVPGPTVIRGTIDHCPSITGVSASTHTATVGVPVAIAASAQDLDVTDVVTYVWSETGPTPLGSFADASAADTTFTCAAAGTTALSIAVSDGICGDAATAAITLDCLAPAAD
jgi:hypothetical protein